VTTFARFSEHQEAGRLLDAALREGPAHAYLFHGPPGVGKREVARTFARSLLGTEREFHADLYELDALGEMIRIDAIRELRRDLHMRPFEADRRVYLIFGAHSMNEEAADALLKDLEEPPAYAVIVLVALRRVAVMHIAMICCDLTAGGWFDAAPSADGMTGCGGRRSKK